MTRPAFALIFALLAGACSVFRPPPPSPPAPAPPSFEQQVEELKFRLFVLVEEQRHRLNREARPLALDPQLSAAAQVHSDDMARKGSFDTMNPDGNPALNVLLGDPKFRGFVGENSAAQLFRPDQQFDPDALARAFLDIWLNSPGHKSNLSFSPYNRTGIGVSVGENLIFAAEVFATDFDSTGP